MSVNGNVTRSKHFAIKSRAGWRRRCFAPEQFNLATRERCSPAPAGSGRIKEEDDPELDILENLLVKTTTSLDQAMHGNVADKRKSLLEIGVWICVCIQRPNLSDGLTGPGQHRDSFPLLGWGHVSCVNDQP